MEPLNETEVFEPAVVLKRLDDLLAFCTAINDKVNALSQLVRMQEESLRVQEEILKVYQRVLETDRIWKRYMEEGKR